MDGDIRRLSDFGRFDPCKLRFLALPIVVQIHGGGYLSGSAQLYHGDSMVNASDGNLIYVSIQYRLGMFRFLAGSQIAGNGDLNVGLLDQRLALE